MNLERVRVVKSVRQVVVPQGPPRKAVTASVPNRELVSLKAECDRQRELTKMRAVQVEEQKPLMEHTILAGAVQVAATQAAMQVAAMINDGEQTPHLTRSPSGRSPQYRLPPGARFEAGQGTRQDIPTCNCRS